MTFTIAEKTVNYKTKQNKTKDNDSVLLLKRFQIQQIL